MAQAEVIREYLVSLGFKTDDKSLKNFTNGIEQAAKGVTKLVTAIQGAALTVGAGVAAFAANLEALYFAAQRTGASATNLKAFEKAAQNFGASSGEALQSVEALARFMRTTPGSEGFLQSLGVQTRNANGEIKDTTELLLELGQKLKQKDYYVAKQYGDLLGISENTLRAMINGDFAREIDQQRERLKRTGFDQASKDAHKFMENLRELATYVEAFSLKVQEALMKRLGVSMDKLSDWFVINGPKIAERLANIIVMFMRIAEAVIPILATLAGWLIDLDNATDGWSTKIIALVAVMRVLGGFALINGILALAGAFKTLGTSIAAAEAAAGAGGAGGLLAKFGPMLGRMAGVAGLALYSGNLNEGEDEWAAEQRRKYNTRGNGQPGSGGSNNTGTKEEAMSYFMGQGWTKEQAAGIVANLFAESGKDGRLNAGAVNGSHYGIAQWDKNRQRNFAMWSGHDIRDSNIAEQLAFVNYELTQGAERQAGSLLRASRNANQAGRIVSSQYERHAEGAAEESKRANNAVQIAQTTNINVSGGGDPSATGRAVAGEQNRVNQQLARNMNTAVN